MALVPPLVIPPLGISEGEARTRFAALQRKLVSLWEHIRRFNDSEQRIVIVPLQTIEFDCKVKAPSPASGRLPSAKRWFLRHSW